MFSWKNILSGCIGSPKSIVHYGRWPTHIVEQLAVFATNTNSSYMEQSVFQCLIFIKISLTMASEVIWDKKKKKNNCFLRYDGIAWEVKYQAEQFLLEN
jgi:hypothetical protein